MGTASDGPACDSSTSSAGCLEPLQLHGGWAAACDSTDVLRLAHALAAPLEDEDARDGGAGVLRLRLRCDEGPPAHALPRGVLSPYANAVCMVAQALRLGGGRPAPGAPPLHALDVAMPDWAQPWECATVAVAFAWSLSEPGPLRTLALHLPRPQGLALLEPQHAAALHEALRMRQANERLALLMGTHKRLGAGSLIKLLPPDLLARVFGFCACTLRLSPPAVQLVAVPPVPEAIAMTPHSASASADGRLSRGAGCDTPAEQLGDACAGAAAAMPAARRRGAARARCAHVSKKPVARRGARCSRSDAARAAAAAAAAEEEADAGALSDAASVDGVTRCGAAVAASPVARRRTTLPEAQCGESRGC